MTFRSIFFSIPVLAWMSGIVATAGPIEIGHQPMTLNRAELTVVGPQGEARFSAEDLEEIGFHRLTTITPWRETPAAFDGVLLTDLLAANGLSGASAISVVAENDYTVVIEAETWKRWPILLATRVNGLPHSRRKRGPIQFVLPMSDDQTSGLAEHHNNWVWMAARIEAVME